MWVCAGEWKWDIKLRTVAVSMRQILAYYIGYTYIGCFDYGMNF